MSKRTAFWDNLKFAIICMVVVSHGIVNHIEASLMNAATIVFINTFHMPLFIFISGLFHKNKDISQRIVLMLSYALYFKILNMEFGNLLGEGKAISLLYEDSSPWFLIAIVIFTLTTYLLRNINYKYILVLSVVIGSLCGYDASISSSQLWSRVFCWFPYYFLGSIMRPESITGFLNKKIVKIIGLCSIMIFGGSCIVFRQSIWKLMYLAIPTNLYSVMPFYCNGLIRIIHYLSVCLISIGFMVCIPQKEIKGVTHFGKNTLSVYIYHTFVRSLFYRYGITDFLCSYRLGIVLLCMINIIVTIILLFDIFSFPTNYIRRLCYTSNVNDEKGLDQL